MTSFIHRRAMAARMLAAASFSIGWRSNVIGSTSDLLPGLSFEIEIPITGRIRKATIYVPGRYDTRHAWPLVFALHPFMQPNVSWERYVEMKSAAERHGFLMVMPRGSGALCFRTFRHSPEIQPNKPDDIAFVLAILSWIRARYQVDDSRIYAIGHSNGGMFAHTLATSLPGVLAGLVSVSGPPGLPLSLSTPPTPVMLVHGTSDNIIPWTGPTLRTPKFAKFIDLNETLAQWRQINGATAAPLVTILDRSGDRTHIVKFDWPSPPAAAETVMLRVENGGHRWPDLEKKRYFPFTGQQSQDIDMVDFAWEFLGRQRRIIES